MNSNLKLLLLLLFCLRYEVQAQQQPTDRQLKNDLFGYREQAEQYRHDSNYRASAELYDRLLQLHPTDTLSYLGRARASAALVFNEPAFTDYQLYLALDSLNPEAYYEAAELAHKLQKPYFGLRWLNRLLSLPVAGRETTTLYFSGYSENGKRYIDRVSTMQSSNRSAVYHLLARLHRQIDDTENAIAAYDKALEHEQTSVHLSAEYADFLLRNKKPTAAAEVLKAALAASPTNEDLLLLLYDMVSAGYETDISTVEIYESGQSRFSAEALSTLGFIAFAEKKYSKAAFHFREAVALAPNETAYQLELGRAYSRAGKFTEAEQVLKQLLQLQPANGRAHAALGAVYFKQQKWQEALAAYTTASNLPYATAADFFNKAQLHRKLKQNAAACSALTEAKSRGFSVEGGKEKWGCE